MKSEKSPICCSCVNALAVTICIQELVSQFQIHMQYFGSYYFYQYTRRHASSHSPLLPISSGLLNDLCMKNYKEWAWQLVQISLLWHTQSDQNMQSEHVRDMQVLQLKTSVISKFAAPTIDSTNRGEGYHRIEVSSYLWTVVAHNLPTQTLKTESGWRESLHCQEQHLHPTRTSLQ